MATQKLILNTALVTQNFFDDTNLLGVVLPISDYQFCWHINKLLYYDFRNNNNREIHLVKNKRNYYFSIYQFNIPNTELTHYIYNNKYDGEYLLPEFKHLDFLWLTKGETMSSTHIQQIVQSIKLVPQVQLVTILTNEKIKHKEYLVL